MGVSASNIYFSVKNIYSGHRFLLRLLVQAQCKNRSNPTLILPIVKLSFQIQEEILKQNKEVFRLFFEDLNVLQRKTFLQKST